MVYTVYKTINLKDNKFYIGVHKTKNPEDEYLGSGKYLKRAIEKYGRSSFRKDILFIFENAEDAFSKEAELLSEEVLSSKLCYNLKKGGEGGFDLINKHGLNVDITKQQKRDPSLLKRSVKRMHARLKFLRENDKNFSDSLNEKNSRRMHKWYENNTSSFVTLNSELAFQERRKETFREIGHAKGEKNSQFGTCWITNGIENKKIKKIDLPDWILKGWQNGRCMK